MSYINMDHAGWVERNIRAGKTLYARSKAAQRKATEHKGWLAAPDELNPFQRRAFNILGIVGNGIYNAPLVWESVYWDHRVICMGWRHTLATFDFTALTRFVFLCHEARIRGEIAPKGFHLLEITLSERAEDGGNSRSHPSLEQALATWREEFPADHSIIYRKSSDVSVEGNACKSTGQGVPVSDQQTLAEQSHKLGAGLESGTSDSGGEEAA